MGNQPGLRLPKCFIELMNTVGHGQIAHLCVSFFASLSCSQLIIYRYLPTLFIPNDNHIQLEIPIIVVIKLIF